MSSSNREFRLVAPPADGLAEAFRAAAARRRRKAATTGGAGVTAAVLVLAALTGTSGQVLTQEPAPPARQTTPDLLETGPGPAPDSVPQDAVEPIERSREDDAASASATTTSRPGAPGTRSDAARRPSAQAPVPPQATEGEQTRRAPIPGYRPGEMKRSQDTLYLPALDCPDTIGIGLCSDVRYFEAPDGKGKYAGMLQFGLCNGGTATAVLGFETRDELDLVVRSKGQVVWQWSLGRPRVSEPHNLLLAAGSCSYWETAWPRVDSAGRPLPRGSYVLAGELATPDAGSARKNETNHTIS